MFGSILGACFQKFLNPQLRSMIYGGVVLVLGVYVAPLNGQTINPAVTSTADRPNIIVINLDDADVGLFSDDLLTEYLPNFHAIARQGMRFSNCHATTPLCGPSRVCLLRGQYAHRTGIKTNTGTNQLSNGFPGGYELFAERGFAREHVGGWLQDAGYRTMLVGKYLHGHMPGTAMPGWDDQHISFGGFYFGPLFYSTRFAEGERLRPRDTTQYRTIQETEAIVAYIRDHAQRRSKQDVKQPFFLFVNPLAPHLPAVGTPMLPPELNDQGEAIQLPVTADFNETDISDKPLHLQVRRLSAQNQQAQHESHRARLLSLVPVDKLLKTVQETLAAENLLTNTIIVVTSDHGYQLGHNRMIGKQLPYHRCTNIPLLVCGPKIPVGVTRNQLVANIDLAPTLLELAGVNLEQNSPVEFDGRSLVPLLCEPVNSPAELHPELLIENWESKGPLVDVVSAAYSSRRTSSTIYTEWSNGAREYYDLTSDPLQLQNQFGAVSSAQRAELSKELHALKTGDFAPIVTWATSGMIGGRPKLSGYAEDVNGVEQVAIQINHPVSGDYFDGQDWQPEPKSFPAKLLNPQGLLTEWEFQIDLQNIDALKEVQFSAVAKNQAGSVSQTQRRSFSIDPAAPETEMRLPQDQSTVESPVMLFGVCSDNITVTGIQLMLKNTTENRYWNGQDWVAQESTFLRPLRNNARWNVKIPVSAGEYEASAAAYDAAGNIDLSPAASHFWVK